MQLTEELKEEIKRLYNETPNNIHGVSLGYKYKNGLKTNLAGIVFNVDKKISESDLSSDQILPKIIKVGNCEYVTDVKEVPRIEMLSCYCTSDPCPSDPEINRLKSFDPNGGNALLPMRGGQEIQQFPTNWDPVPGQPGYWYASVGTLGFFCIDNIDNKIVGVTNSHVVCNRRLAGSDRDLISEISDVYNTSEPRIWNFDNKYYYPGSTIFSGNFLPIARIKRYQPVKYTEYNYSDVALLIMSPSVISSSQSYKVWQPTTVSDYTGFLTFATTAEIDNLLSTNPRLYSTGRTTGPKGYLNTATCRLRVNSLGVSGGVNFDLEGVTPWADMIEFKYEDNTTGAALSGDSGSALLADIGGVRKIIGLVFAGNTSTGFACRIDKVAAEMNIRAWDGTYDAAIPTTFSAVVTNPLDIKSGQTSLVYNGKTYYQTGFTKTTGLTQIN